MATQITRRRLLQGVCISTAGLLAAACVPARQGPAAPAAPTETQPFRAPKEPITLVQANWGTAARHQLRDAALREVFPELEMMPVKFEVVESTPEMLRLRLAAGTGIPDMIRFNVPHYAEFVHADELMDVSDLFEPVEDDLYVGARNLCSSEGRYIAFPCQIKSKMFFYRTDLYEEAGIDVNAIVTFQDFVNAGKTLLESFPGSHIINLAGEPAGYWLHLLLSGYPDARIADPDGTYVFDTNDAFRDSFSFLKELRDSGVCFPTDDWSADWAPSFADESTCGSLLSNWMKQFIPGFAPQQSLKWGSALWPSLEPYGNQRIGSEAGGAVYSVPKRCAHPMEAAEYLRMNWLTTEGWKASFRSEGLTPLMKSAEEYAMEFNRNPVRPAGMTDEAWAAYPSNYFGPELLKVEIESYDHVTILPYDPSNLMQFTLLRDWLIKFMANEATLDEALTGARQDMELNIGNPFEL